MKSQELVLKIGHEARCAPCGLCREVVKFNVGAAVFTAANMRPVCVNCGLKAEPRLVGLLGTLFVSNRGELFVRKGHRILYYAQDLADDDPTIDGFHYFS